VAAITFAMYATAHAGESVPRDTPEGPITFLPMVPAHAPPTTAPKPPHIDDDLSAPPIKGFQTLTAPIDIPDRIPDVDLSQAVTNADDFRGTGARDGRANDVEAETPTHDDHAYFEFQVEKPALARDANSPPRYPSMLERSRVEGELLAQFVVDTTGKADMSTLEILHATNALFSASLASALPHWRFYPAEAGGRKVRQLVQVPIRFTAPLR
jgi:protein TonB